MTGQPFKHNLCGGIPGADTHNHTTISLLSHSATAAQQSSMIGFQNVDSGGIVHNPGVQRWPDGGDRSAAQPPAQLQGI